MLQTSLSKMNANMIIYFISISLSVAIMMLLSHGENESSFIFFENNASDGFAKPKC